MATLLYRIGRFSYQRAPWVIVAWLVVLAGALGAGVGLGGTPQESYTIPGTQSQDALDRLEAVFPETAGGSAQVVLEAPQGEAVTDSANKERIEQAADDLAEVPHVASALSPFSEYAGDSVSDDESMAIITVQFDDPSYELSDDTLQAVKDAAAPLRDNGITVAFGGDAFQDIEFGISIIEVLGVVFAGVVLVVTFGSLLAAGMPLLVSLVGVGITMGGVLAVASFTTVSSASPMLALMLGIAVGIDYALFIVSRHRNQLAQGMSAGESAAIAVGTAGSAVVFAGTTVVIALLGLLVVGIPFLSVMGVAAAAAVVLAVAVSVTLVPAVLGLAGERLRPREGSRAWRRAHAHKGDRPTLGGRWVRLVTKAPLAWIIGVIAVLGTLAVPAAQLDLNLPTGASEPAGSTQRVAYDMVDRGFGPGYNGPLIVAVDITQTTDVLDDLDGIRDQLGELDDVAYVSEGIPNPTLDTAIIRVIPDSAPDSPETKDLVHAIRDLGPQLEQDFDTPVAVTGMTAVAVDISNRLADALIPFALVVVGLSIILLMMVFRSVLVPLKAALGFLLSISAAIGVVVAVFQLGWFSSLIGVDQPGPILSFLPIIMMALLFGLAMDYEMFLVSGVREHYVHTGRAHEAIVTGSAQAMRVVTAAALIMIFVFSAFIPEGSGVIKPIALGLAVGIACDAFLVRMTLGPAVLALVRRAAWWLPSWLSRILPNADVEGDGLRRHREDAEWARSQTAAITAERLRVATGAGTFGPVDLRVAAGGVLAVSGPAEARTALSWLFTGRLDPADGRLQVAGHALPSDRATVQRRAVRVSAALDAAAGSVGDVIREHVQQASTWRLTASRRRTADVLARVNRALIALDRSPIAAEAPWRASAGLERALVALAAGMIERPRVLALELGSDVGPEQADALRRALDDVTDDSVTLVVASARPMPWGSGHTGPTGSTGADAPASRPVVVYEASQNTAETSERVVTP